MANRLFVGNLNPRTTREQVERFFASAGLRVAAVRLPVDQTTGQPRGFAFVDFEQRRDAENCLAVFDGRELGGQRLRVRWARERPDARSTQPESEFSELEPVAARGDGAHESGFPYPVAEDYTRDRGRRTRRRGKHGSDRRHRIGVRRRID